MSALEPLRGAIERYLARRWSHLQNFAIIDIQQIPGGASRETYRIAATYRENGADARRGYIFRRDPPSSLIDTNRALEYQTYAAVFPTAVPVPEPLILEESPGELERPFSVMAEIAGCETAIPNFATPAYLPLREKIGTQKWSILGRLAAMDVDELGVTRFMEAPNRADCARRELDYWAGVIAADSLHPQPIAAAAIRWLKREPPPAQ